MAFRVAENGLKDLDLVRPRDSLEVRRESRGVGVVYIAGDGAVGIELARLEHNVAVCSGDRDMEPCASRWVGRRQLVASQVFNAHSKSQFTAEESGRSNGYPCCLRLQE